MKTKLPMKQFRETLFSALLGAGNLIAREMYRAKKLSYKENSTFNIVTSVDHAADKLIQQTILKRFPDHDLLTEESIPTDKHSDFKWIIDPLDGTINYAHHIPQCAPSIGLEYKGEIILGGVYDPFRKELFWAEKGKGAFLKFAGRTTRIRPSPTKKLTGAVLVTGFPYDRTKHIDTYLAYLKAFLGYIQGIRRLGAAALDLCWVACGRFDGYWEWRLKPWDCAAGKLIVEEAGGRMSDFTGKPFSIYGQQTLATNSRIHEEMLAVMKKLPQVVK